MSIVDKRTRTRRGEATKFCVYCNQDKDIVEFRTYKYKPTKNGKAGKEERRRLDKCHKCRGKTV